MGVHHLHSSDAIAQRNIDRGDSGFRVTSGRVPLRLSPREEAIIRRIALGYSDKQIACDLNISPRTVRSHIVRIFLRHSLRNRAEAAAAWVTALANTQLQTELNTQPIAEQPRR